jgi:hypothetical protein
VPEKISFKINAVKNKAGDHVKPPALFSQLRQVTDDCSAEKI